MKENAVPLSVADMEFYNAPEITEGLQRFLQTAVLGYTDPTEAYFQAVTDWMARRKGWSVRKEEIVCSPGVIPALYAAVRAFTEPGDGVLLMTPAYPPFYSAVKENGRRVVPSALINREGSYSMDLADIDEKTRPEDVKLLFLCNPHNPTGRSWRPEELRRLGEICRKNHLIVMSDEIHSDLMMPGITHSVFAALSPELADIALTCTAPSKTFNLAGMQTSNIVISNPELRRAFRREMIVSSGGGLLNILGYEACRIAYTECEAWLEELIGVIWENYGFVKEAVAETLPKAVISPLEGTYLAWLDLRAYGLSPEEMEKRHVQADLFLDEGHIFGPEGNGFERINLACPKWVLEDAMERLSAIYEERCGSL